MTRSRRCSTFKTLVAERLEHRFVLDGSASFMDWDMGNDLVNAQAETAYLAQDSSSIAIKEMTLAFGNVDDAPSEFRMELDGLPIAQDLRDNTLFVVLNRPDGTGAIDEFDISDVNSPQRVSRVNIPNIITAANFFDDILVLQTIDQNDLPAVTPVLTVVATMNSVELSPFGDSSVSLVDGFFGTLPLPTLQILEINRLSDGVVATHPLSNPVEHLFVMDSELFTATSNMYTPASMDVHPETRIDRFHLDIDSGTLNLAESLSIDGEIMSTDIGQSDTTQSLSLLMQSYSNLPFSELGSVSVEQFSIDSNGKLERKRIPVTLPSGDNWVSSFEFQNGRWVLGSPHGLTLVDATGTGPVVSTSLAYENQFSSWAELDAQIYLRIANDVDSGNGSISNQSVELDVLDVSDFSHPKTIVSKSFGEINSSDQNWAWSVVENDVLKQADGKYMLVMPTSWDSATDFQAGPVEDCDLSSIGSVVLPWSLDSTVQLVAITLSPEFPTAIELSGEFAIAFPFTEVHQDNNILALSGIGELALVNLDQKPLTPNRVAFRNHNSMLVDPQENQWDETMNALARNPDNPTDTNSDGSTNEFDVLLLINELNMRGPYALPNRSTSIDHSILGDVNGDLWLTPLDVLVIINWINRESDSDLNKVASSTTFALAASNTTQCVSATTESVDNFMSRLIDSLPVAPNSASKVQSTSLQSRTHFTEEQNIDFAFADEELNDSLHTIANELFESTLR